MSWHRLALVFLWLTGSAAAFDQITIRAAFDPDQKTVTGEAGYLFSAKGTDYDAVRFRLYPNLICEDDTVLAGIQVDSASVGGISDIELIADGTDLLVKLPTTVRSNDSLGITLFFRTVIPDQGGRFGHAAGLFNLEAWFPFPAPWRDGEWTRIEYCRLCEPVGEHYNIDATFQMPDSLSLMAPGILAREVADSMATVRLRLNRAQDLALSISADFEQYQFETSGVTVTVWYRPDQAHTVDTTETVTVRALEIMNDYVGKYPFDELVIVVGGLDTGEALELPRLIWMYEIGRFGFVRIYQTTLIHEIVHQWFYGIVASDQASDPWLDEAISEYFNDELNLLIMDGKPDVLDQFGMTMSNIGMNRMASRSVWEMYPITRRASSFSPREYGQTVYSKGALVMRTLTNLMGEEGEKQFWREYYENYKFSRPVADDFIRAAASYFPTGDPNDVKRLIEITVRPDYAIDSVALRDSTVQSDDMEATEDTAAEKSTKFVDVVISSTHPLPTEIVLHVGFADGSSRDTSFVPIGGRETITFASDFRPVVAILDPDGVYAIDANLLNNSLQGGTGSGNSLRLFSGIFYLVESLFSTVWGI